MGVLMAMETSEGGERNKRGCFFGREREVIVLNRAG